MIVIINYGMGNLGSIFNMLKKMGVEAIISSDCSEIEKADKLILPGVGSFDNGMKNIVELGLLQPLHKKIIEEKTPILGICLGMQLFTKKSEEGTLPGLGWLDGEVIKFDFHDKKGSTKIPHMGWNSISAIRQDTLLSGLSSESRFYFVHSYYVVCGEEDILAKTYYGYDFASVVRKDNIFGIQFHPEKSHKYGVRIFDNFSKMIH